MALGFTLGVGLSLIPIPFLGMALAIGLAPFLRASPAATYLGTAVVNPVTGAAFYFAELWLGAALLGVEPPAWSVARRFESDDWRALLQELLPAFALGGVLFASAVALVAYPVVRALVQRYQRANPRPAGSAAPPDDDIT